SEDDPAGGVGEGQYTDEAGGAEVIRHGGELMEQKSVVVGLAAAGVVELGPAGAVDAGFARQGIDFQAGVVGDGPGMQVASVIGGLEAGIGTKGAAGLLGGGELIAMSGQVIPLELIAAEHFAEFADLAGVGGGDEEAHAGRVSRRWI